MNAQTLLDNFSTFADAPGGIPRLRELILSLAVMGQLSDVSAWTEGCLDDFVSESITDGDWIESKDQDPQGEIRLLQLADVGFGIFKDKSSKYVNSSTFRRLNCTPLRPNDVLIARLPDPIGRACVFPGSEQECITVVDVAIVRTDTKVLLPSFLVILMNSPAMRARVISLAAGTTRLRIATGKIRRMPISIPTSVRQQEEIVRSVDELMALCDQLEAAKAERDSLRTAARKSAIDAVSTASTADELSTAWARIQDNWTTYADTPESISDLRSIIHDLAVRGMLADNQPTELPFDVENVEGPYEIPSNWRWAKLEDIANYGGRGNVQPLSIRESDWILDLEDIEKSSSRLLQRVYASARKTTSNKASFEPGDVLYGKLRPYLDKVLVADEPGFCTTEIVPITPLLGIDSYWLRLSLKSPLFIQYVIEKSYGMKMPRLGTKDAKASIHAVPPLAEQVRIVAKVDELMALCDQLENELKTRHVFAGQWAASVVHHIGDAA